jgi:hypothetical protein
MGEEKDEGGRGSLGRVVCCFTKFVLNPNCAVILHWIMIFFPKQTLLIYSIDTVNKSIFISACVYG